MKTLLLITTLIFATAALSSNAQKLPNIQAESVQAPGQVNVDGKFKEWGSRFHAYNHAADVYYTIANDENNLYLVAQASDDIVINKILRGGLTFSVKGAGKKDAGDAVAITYPVSDYPFSIHFNFHTGRALDTSLERIEPIVENNNKLIEQHIKTIAVKGIAGLDSSISIYNENDIKAAGLLALNRVYVLELAVPLRYLHLKAGESKIDYHIILNGYKSQSTIISITNKDGSPATGPRIDAMMATAAQMDAAWSARTDFWGEYTLAKEPLQH